MWTRASLIKARMQSTKRRILLINIKDAISMDKDVTDRNKDAIDQRTILLIKDVMHQASEQTSPSFEKVS
jgi:hypothetical protein